MCLRAATSSFGVCILASVKWAQLGGRLLGSLRAALSVKAARDEMFNRRSCVPHCPFPRVYEGCSQVRAWAPPATTSWAWPLVLKASFKETRQREEQRLEMWAMWPHWEKEQMNRSSEPQVHQGPGMGLNRGQEVHIHDQFLCLPLLLV